MKLLQYSYLPNTATFFSFAISIFEESSKIYRYGVLATNDDPMLLSATLFYPQDCKFLFLQFTSGLLLLLYLFLYYQVSYLLIPYLSLRLKVIKNSLNYCRRIFALILLIELEVFMFFPIWFLFQICTFKMISEVNLINLINFMSFFFISLFMHLIFNAYSLFFYVFRFFFKFEFFKVSFHLLELITYFEQHLFQSFSKKFLMIKLRHFQSFSSYGFQ
jgi:hypothetical protein